VKGATMTMIVMCEKRAVVTMIFICVRRPSWQWSYGR
jgi:hypothetical protein